MRGALNSLAVLLALAAACDTRPSGSAKPPPPPEPPAVEADPLAPPPIPERARPTAADGSLDPAPWLGQDVQRVAGYRAPEGAFVVAAGVGWLRVFTPDGKRVAEHAGVGAAQDLEVGDFNGDGQPDLAVARGMDRNARTAPPSVTVMYGAHTADAVSETIGLPETTRAQVSDVAVDGADLLIASYDSKYMVTVLRATRGADGAWTADKVDRVRVLSGLAQVGGELAYARAYGATVEDDGFVTVGDARVPATRGARAIAAAPGGVVYSDGWHREYGKKARALITFAERGPGGWRARTLANVDDRFGFDRIRVGDIDGDRKPDAIASGNGPAITVPLSGERSAQKIDGIDAVDAFPFDLDGDGRDEVVIAGQSPGIWKPLAH